MNPIIKRIVQRNIGKLTKKELAKATSKLDATIYDSKNNKVMGNEDYPTQSQHYVHRHRLIRKGIVHFTNVMHRQEVSFFHPWMKGYLEKVGKALWSKPPLFCRPSEDDKSEPKEDEIIKQAWEDKRLQEACRKMWHKSQVHGFGFLYPMKGTFFQGYSGPEWTVYSLDEMGEPSDYSQGHPVKWTINHTNKEKNDPKEITIKQGLYYDYKNTDDFTGEPFGIGIWDLLIDWLWIQDAVNAFDQRMGNGFFTLVVPNNTDPTEIAKYEDTIRNTRTEMGIVVRGAVEEPVQMNWVGMAGVQVDFIAHLEKLEDLIAFNMGFPKRWIMGDREGARENGSNDSLQVNIQLKNLYTEWILLIKRILKWYNLISDYKDIIIKPPFELQLSEQEQIELDSIKTDTIAKKTWLSVNEQREEDGYEASEEEGADKIIPEEEPENGSNPGEDKEDQGKKPSSPKSDSEPLTGNYYLDTKMIRCPSCRTHFKATSDTMKRVKVRGINKLMGRCPQCRTNFRLQEVKSAKSDTKSTIWEVDVWIDNGKESAFKNYMYQFDLKDLDLYPVTKRDEDSRYSATFRYFGRGSPWRSGKYWQIKSDWKTGKSDTFETLIDIFTNKKISVRQLAKLCNVSPTTVSKIREKMDSHKNPVFKQDQIVVKCDAVSLGNDIYEIQDVPVILPQRKHYENLGYEAERPKEEIKSFFENDKFPKEYRIGVTITDDHDTPYALEIPNENTVGTVQLKRLDDEGNVRGNIRYSLKDADRILGTDNFIRQHTIDNQNIPTSVALRSRDVPNINGKYIEHDLDIRSFVFSKNNARNKKAGK